MYSISMQKDIDELELFLGEEPEFTSGPCNKERGKLLELLINVEEGPVIGYLSVNPITLEYKFK